MAFAALLAGYLAYAWRFILLTTVVVDGVTYFTLFDDAMVSMRYARNLASGRGLVWNPGGERLEGFTNPLWTLFMAAVHFVGAPPHRICLYVQVAAMLALVATLVQVRRLARRLAPDAPAVSLAAALITAFYLPLNNWTLQGMEVGLLALLATTACVQALRWAKGQTRGIALALTLALAVWVRMDALGVAVAILGFVAIAEPTRRPAAARGLAVVVASLVLQTALRAAYYGDLLPNTYALKMTGVPVAERFAHGVAVAARFLAQAWPLALAGVAAVPALRRNRLALLPPCVFVIQLLYSIWVGGDAWEWWGGANRYVCVAMPAVFVTCVQGLHLVLSRLVGVARPRLAAGLVTVSAAVLLVPFNAVNRNARPIWMLRDRPLHVFENGKNIRRARLLADITLPTASAAVTSAGTVPYYADRQMIDLLGKNDRHVSRLPGRAIPFYPGHMKWDYGYSIGRLRPDVVIELWLSPEEAEPFLRADYRRVRMGEFLWWLRKDSPHVLWDRVARASAPSPSP